MKYLSLIRSLTISAAGMLIASLSIAQEEYPNRPIKLIVPWGPGTGIDVQVRQFADQLGKELKTPIVVENKVGAGSQLGYEVAARSRPDGYTIFAGTNANFIHQYMRPHFNINPTRDMAPITMMFWMPSVLVVAAESPAKDIPSFLEWAKTKPGGLNYGSGGVGSASHLLASTIATRNKLKVTHIPLRSMTADLGPMLTRGDIHFTLPVTGVGAAQIKQGVVRPLAVTSSERLGQWPDVPTLAEAFNDDVFKADSWTALFTPKGTPEPILEKLYAAAVKAVNSEEHKKSAEFFMTLPEASRSRESFGKLFQSESKKWEDIVRDSGISSE